MPTALSNRVIPREQLTAWERWELGALAEGERPAAANTVHAEPDEELKSALNEAIEAARAKGYAEGIKSARAEAARISAVATAATAALDSLGTTLATRVTELAIGIARQIVREELATRPEAILTVVHEAMELKSGSGARVQIVVNPEDAALVAGHMEVHAAVDAWKIVEDARMARGGCRITSGAGDVDATLETRWKKVLESLAPANEN